jgi:hypothetical protein
MKIFHCDHCGHLLFFENTRCVSCGHAVAYLPDLRLVGSLECSGEGPDEIWHSPLPGATAAGYRLCDNYKIEGVCNWAVLADSSDRLCISCRTTRTIPNLSELSNRSAWYRLEVAKRRLLFTLIELGLPIPDRREDARALIFDFLADALPGAPPVLTGHADGVITINVAEADDVERERRRSTLGEPYRTLLGHMRHESGHYYWERLIASSPAIDEFRALFGDERVDYHDALRRYYDRQCPDEWQEHFVTAYATSHPWEDWAETWAQYLHMVDSIETAAACGVSVQPRRCDEPAAPTLPEPMSPEAAAFDHLIDCWFPLTYVLNNLNRGLGHPDAYPFVLSPAAVAKLRFIDRVVGRGRHARPARATEQAVGRDSLAAD